MATALELMRWYRSHTGPDRKVLWAVGENIRLQKKFVHAAELMRGLGHVTSVRVSVQSMVTTDSKHYSKPHPLLPPPSSLRLTPYKT